MFSLTSYLTGTSYNQDTEDGAQSQDSSHPPNKPYQAYCETEAPSRSSTPDSLVPLPLTTKRRTQWDVESKVNVGVRPRPLNVIKPRTAHTYPRQHDIPPQSPGQTETSCSREVYSDRTSSLVVTVSMNRYHIVPQAVIPRGRYFTTPVHPSRYDHAQLLRRTEQTEHIPKATHRTVHRRLSLGTVHNETVKSRPLPPLPIGEFAGGSPRNAVVHLCGGETGSRKSGRSHEDYKEHVLPPLQHTAQMNQLSVLKYYERLEPDPPGRYINTTPNARDYRHTEQRHSRPTALPSYLSAVSSEDHALRRTIPKDAKFTYSFGQRPTFKQDKLAHYDRPLPPLPVSLPHLGPRQPPWGSLDHLSLQRHARNEAREREQARRFRSAMEKQSWLRIAAEGSEDGEGCGGKSEAMRREVEGYRQQITRVYPDMMFDGNAGKGGRSCCCAVM